MSLKLVCVIFILLGATTRNLCAFRVQGENELVSLDVNKVESVTETSGSQALLRRSKRFNSHFPICRYCCNCCGNKGCGFCCRT